MANEQTTRPDWINCVRHDHEDLKTTSWCGRKIISFEWAFTSVDHAAENGRQEGRLVACIACVEAIVAALRNGHEGGGSADEE